MQVKTERLVTLIDPEALVRIDSYRWKKRLNSRAEAVRELIEIGLKTRTAPGDEIGVQAPDAVEA
ncbi:hypothetical protein [Pelagibacterium sp.]|uniref:hypothetical protein n=1 Tax=Pelagibacterium sp. TaxID=1967288 RepID=UPI003BAB3C9F